jgi:hypothetical protein
MLLQPEKESQADLKNKNQSQFQIIFLGQTEMSLTLDLSYRGTEPERLKLSHHT